MKAVVIYESMYGNTRRVAEALGTGLSAIGSVRVLPVAEVTADVTDGADLVVVGGPTHIWGLSRRLTRRAAVSGADERELKLDPASSGPGIREWLTDVRNGGFAVAAFDTRIDAPRLITGRAARGIARRLRRHGLRVIAAPRSFLVTPNSELLEGEEAKAEAWGRKLAEVILSASSIPDRAG